MTRRISIFALALGACLAGPVTAQTAAADTPPGHWAPLPQKPAEVISLAAQLQGQFGQSRRLMTALAERMPAADYGFRPSPDMRTFAAGLAHVISSNFGYCANLIGQPAPHKGEDMEKAAAAKDDAVRLLKESFDFCAPFGAGVTPARLDETYPASSVGPDGQRSAIDVARGGLLVNFIAHNNEMYGYLSVYLRLKGLVPPSSDPRPGRGRIAGPGR